MDLIAFLGDFICKLILPGSLRSADLCIGDFSAEHRNIHRPVQKPFSVEFRILADAVDLLLQGLHFIFKRLSVRLRIRVVRCLHRDLAHTLSHAVHFGHGTFCRIQQRNKGLRIFRCPVQTPDLCFHHIGNSHSDGIIFGMVDRDTRRKLLHCRSHRVFIFPKLRVGNDR